VSKPIALQRQGAAVASSVDEVLGLVRARGGRATPSRRAILEVLFGTEAHMTAEEIATVVQARAPEVNISTIYRNLEDMQRLGVIVHSHFGHGPATYQLASGAHAHFICEVCGATIEAPDEVFAGLARTVAADLGFAIDPVHFAMLGRCAACRRSGG
jgi:Fur family transcriptional regulator, ferric uptake regulator